MNVFRQAGNIAKRAGKLTRIANAARRVARSDEQNSAVAKQALASLLADARGVPMKFGQYLASMPDGEAYADLTRSIEPVPLDVMLPYILEQLPDDPVYQNIQVEPSEAAASLGQVHRATLKDGRRLAIKVQYPDIAAAIDAEMQLVGLVPKLGPAKKWGIDTDGYKSTLRSNMRRELDYRVEAEAQLRYANEVKLPNLVVPHVCLEACTATMLVQSWEDGLPIDAITSWPIDDRRTVGETLVKAFFNSLFHSGTVHCDPHPGNYRFRRDATGTLEVVVLDFGCFVEIPHDAGLSLLKLMMGCRRKDDTDPMACFKGMGFDAEKLVPIAQTLPALCRILFHPFIEDRVFQLKSWNVSERVKTLLGDLRWWFRSAGPPELFLLLRSFSGLLQQLDALKLSVDWWSLVRQAAGPDLLAQADAHHLESTSIDDKGAGPGFDALANLLRIHITEDGHDVVAVAFPAQQVVVIDELIPEDTVSRIQEAGIDIPGIVERAKQSGLIPQELFELDIDERHYRVWLE